MSSLERKEAHFIYYHYISLNFTITNTFMMRIQNIVVSVLLLVLSTIIFIKYRKLTLPKSYTELDNLDTMFVDVRKNIAPNSTIGFLSNTPDGRKGVLYFKTAISLAPIVVEMADSDTLLVIDEPIYPPRPIDQFECILRGGNKDFNYSLVRTKP
jgi:hypothetical protein